MPRAINGTVRKKRVKKILKRAKGFYSRRSKIASIAHQSVKKALANQFIGRKHRKRQFRRLWNIRISAATKKFDFNYSRFMNGLKKASITINRKMLSHLAIHYSQDFQALVELAKKYSQ